MPVFPEVYFALLHISHDVKPLGTQHADNQPK